MLDFNSMSQEELENYLLKANSGASEGAATVSQENLDSLSEEELSYVITNGSLPPEKERNEWAGIGSSVGGALTGAAIGSALPVVGTAIGGIVGGMVGAFGGELLEDELQGKELDYWNATKEASISLGIDVATLGTMKVLKPAYIASKEMLGFKPQEVAAELAEMAKATLPTQKAGTAASLVSTQSLLDETGAKLLPSQLPNASGALLFAENIGRIGVMSSTDFTTNMSKVNQAVTGGVDDLIAKTKVEPLNKMELGQTVEGIFKEAKSALSKQYEIGLDSVMAKSANDMVDISPIYKTLDRLINAKSTIIGNTLQEETKRHAKDLLSSLAGGLPVTKDIIGDVAGKSSVLSSTGLMVPRMVKGVVGTEKVVQKLPVAHLIAWEKKNKALLRELGNPKSPLYNSTVDKELGTLVGRLGGAIDNTMAKANNEAFKEYKAVKAAYGKGIESIRPEAIKGLLNQASKKTFEPLARTLLANNGSLSKFKATWGAIQSSVNMLSKDNLTNLGVTHKGELFNKIKASYLEDAFPSIKDVGFDVTNLAKGFKSMSRESTEQVKMVLGKDFGRFNQIKNAIIDTAKKPSSNFYALSLRSKEASAAAQGAGSILAGGAVGGIGGIAAAAAVLLTPKVLGRIALNGGHTARLLNILGGKGKSKTVKGTEDAIALLLAELTDTAVD